MGNDRQRFSGVVVPIVNPCKEDDRPDWEALERNAQRLLTPQIQGFYINGGTGDAASLTRQERLDIAAYMVKAAKSAGKLAIVHVGQTTLREAVLLAEQAMTLGADAVASIPPRKGWPQVAAYYRTLAATGAPTFVYDIPGMTGMTPGMPELRTLLEIPGVVGLKLSDWNVFLACCIRREFPDTIIYSGFDEMLVPGLLYGADGCIGTWINLLPKTYAAIYRRVCAGRINEILPLMRRFTTFLAVCNVRPPLNTFESLMLAKGYAARCFRNPSAWDPNEIDSRTTDLLCRTVDELEADAGRLMENKERPAAQSQRQENAAATF